jgi:glycosyltransferase involved in cell wall biosynthesis
MKVLVSVYACEPDKGSEPGVGWNWVKQIARFHEVWAITRTNNREAIERAIGEKPPANVHWIYFDLPYWLRFWKKGQRGTQLYYYLWQIGAYHVAKRLHGRVAFQVVHHVTFVKYWVPSFLAFLPAPFVWGPVGGGEVTPEPFYKSFSFRGKVYERLRNMARCVAEKDPFLRSAARRTRLAVATTRDTESRLRGLGCQSVTIFPAIGMGEYETGKLKRVHEADSFRLVSIGRLLHWKGFHLGLMAFARFQQTFPNSEYHLIGDGPERQHLENLAQKSCIPGTVRFWGHLPRARALAKLMRAGVLVHPSLHDSGGWVCMEAMTAGCPVICLDIGGPALQVTEATGIKVEASDPGQVINDLARAMLELARNGILRESMSRAGRQRVLRDFSWDKKGEWIRDVYQQVCAPLLNEKPPVLPAGAQRKRSECR